MTKRQCGECTACCEGWITSKHIDMQPGKPCVHCRSTGCAIYEKRPQDPCRSFVCGWLQDDSPLPESMRPDRCGAIVAFNRNLLGMTVFVAAPVGSDIPKDTLDWLMRYAMQRHLPLLYWANRFDNGRFAGQAQSGFGPPEFQRAVLTAKGPFEVMGE